MANPSASLRTRLGLTLFGALSLSACGGAQPTPELRDAVTEQAKTPALAAEFPPLGAPLGPPRIEWGGGRALPPDAARVGSALAMQPSSAADDCLAGQVAVRFAADGIVPGPAWLSQLADHCGLADAPTDAFAVTAPSLAALEAGLSRLPIDVVTQSAGLGLVTHRDGRATLALTPAPTNFTLLEPLSRAQAAGAMVTVRARVRPGTEHAALVAVSASTAPPRVIPLPASTTGEVAFSFEMPTEAAAAVAVEVTRVEGRFARAIGALRFGASETPLPPPAAAPRVAGASPRLEQEATLRIALTSARQAAGRAPLASGGGEALLDAWFDAAATEQATGDPPLPKASNGDPFVHATWVFGTGGSPVDALERLVASPLGRLSLLNDPAASPTHVSFGVRPYDGRPGADVMVVLLRAFAPLSIDALRPALHDAVARLVRPATAPALEPSAALDAVAQALAAEILSGKVAWGALPNEAGRRVAATDVGATAFAAGAVAVENASMIDLSAEPALRDGGFDRVGFGLVSGRPAGDAKPRHVLVYVVSNHTP